jgi:YHS domain-containing protein
MKEGSMQSERPDVVIDPVCGMRVSVDDAEADGLLVELDGRTWAFCREACRDAFISEPAGYVARAMAAPAAAGPADAGAAPDIDEGFRRWYESCLSDAYPDIKARLDAERAAAAQPPVDEGICVTAEAAEASSAPTA